MLYDVICANGFIFLYCGMVINPYQSIIYPLHGLGFTIWIGNHCISIEWLSINP